MTNTSATHHHDPSSLPYIHPLVAQGVRQLASGRWVVFEDGKIIYKATSEGDAFAWCYGEPDPPTCSICGGYHGSICPIEEPFGEVE